MQEINLATHVSCPTMQNQPSINTTTIHSHDSSINNLQVSIHCDRTNKNNMKHIQKSKLTTFPTLPSHTHANNMYYYPYRPSLSSHTLNDHAYADTTFTNKNPNHISHNIQTSVSMQERNISTHLSFPTVENHPSINTNPIHSPKSSTNNL